MRFLVGISTTYSLNYIMNIKVNVEIFGSMTHNSFIDHPHDIKPVKKNQTFEENRIKVQFSL